MQRQTKSIGISKLNRTNLKELRELKDVLLVEEFNGKPVVVVIPYGYYVEMQGVILRLEKEIDERLCQK